MDVLPPAALLRLIWLASAALPVGAFCYSEGLEAAIDAGLVHDEASAATWLLQQLELSLARSELPLSGNRPEGEVKLRVHGRTRSGSAVVSAALDS